MERASKFTHSRIQVIFLGDSYSQVHRAFRKGILGFGVKAVFAPHRSGRPRVRGEVTGQGLGRITCSEHLCREGPGEMSHLQQSCSRLVLTQNFS